MSNGFGPLSGMRVIELTHAWAGPYCGMMLGDLGAEVIKIENPRQEPEARGGYPYIGGESVIFMMLHRNKKSVTLDLKSEDGRAIFLDLIKDADAIIQNFRPGVMEKLGLTYERMKKVNPALIYATLSGYGSSGPKAGLAGVNMIALAESGLASTTIHDGSPPVPLGYALCDIVAAMWTSHAILAAYVHRMKTGEGQQIDMSLLEAGISLMYSPLAMNDHAGGNWQRTSRTDGNAPSGFFQGGDGAWFTVFASYPALWDRFVGVVKVGLENDPRFSTRDKRTSSAVELHKVIGDEFRKESADFWVERFQKAGVPAAKVNSVREVAEDAHVNARHMVVEQEHPTAGALRLFGVPAKFSETPGEIRTPSPSLGQHTLEVLDRLGYGARAEDLRSKGVV